MHKLKNYYYPDETRKIYNDHYTILLDRKNRVIWASGNIFHIMADGYKLHNNLNAVLLHPGSKYDCLTVFTMERIPSDKDMKVLPWRAYYESIRP